MTSFPLARPKALWPRWVEVRWSALWSSAFGQRELPLEPQPEPRETGADTDCRAAMRSVLETQIIPRLLQATRATPVESSDVHRGKVEGTDVEDFARLCATGDRSACETLVARLRAGGLQPDGVLLDLVTPAARRLGQRWEEDTLDFMSVTVGLVMMHELVHGLGYEVHDGPQTCGAVRRVMLASAPGSQHVLGLSIVSEFFRKAGWQVVIEVSPSAHELCRAVGNEWFDLLGVSVALDSQLVDLQALIGRLRKASRNGDAPVLLGGPAFTRDGLQAESFGAHAICRDAREAINMAAELVRR